VQWNYGEVLSRLLFQTWSFHVTFFLPLINIARKSFKWSSLVSLTYMEQISWFNTIKIITSLQILEVVNICHSLIWNRVGDVVELYTIHDLRSHLSRVGLQKLLVCNRRRCLKCTNKKNRDPRRASFGHMVDVWRQDEIISLAHWFWSIYSRMYNL
jgi:hypothetical protein